MHLKDTVIKQGLDRLIIPKFHASLSGNNGDRCAPRRLDRHRTYLCRLRHGTHCTVGNLVRSRLLLAAGRTIRTTLTQTTDEHLFHLVAWRESRVLLIKLTFLQWLLH